LLRTSPNHAAPAETYTLSLHDALPILEEHLTPWAVIDCAQLLNQNKGRHPLAAENLTADVHDVVIIGSGPAGYTAAIYASRANLNPVLFTSSVESGGELMNTTDVENYPGFPEGIMGPELMSHFEAQARRFGTDVQYEDVTDLDLTAEPKR